MKTESEFVKTMSPPPRQLESIVAAVRELLAKGSFHHWVGQAMLSHPAILAPLIVERHETLEENLAHVFLLLTDDEKNDFRTAISRATKEYWPPDTISVAAALRSIFRLARLSGHYGLLRWIGDELMRRLAQPKTIPDLRILAEIIALMARAEQWIDDSEEDGPDYRSVLSKLHGLFERLAGTRSLSFLDAALILPAVRFHREHWSHVVCAAIDRYDIRSTKAFPDDWPTFGTERSPEGIGLYDLRGIIRRVIQDLNIFQLQIGVKIIAGRSSERDHASNVLIQILIEQGFLNSKLEIIETMPHPTISAFFETQPSLIYYLGPEYVSSVHHNIFRFVTTSALEIWSRNNWSAATAILNLSDDYLALYRSIAFVPGLVREIGEDELTTDTAYAPVHEDARVRRFGEFRTTGLAANVASISEW